MKVRRQTPQPRLISLVSMIDVLLIMLVFFMVTSTYLNLDMIPMTRTAADGAVTDARQNTVPVMIRLGADGVPYLQGRPFAYDVLADHLATLPAQSTVMILPSLRASTQSLVTLMDVATTAGIQSLRVVQVATP
jgi:biopolymer transport protein ExbD